MKTNEAYEFERGQRLHESRKENGILNRLTPRHWRVYHDDRLNQKSVALVGSLIRELRRPVVLSIGAGGGGLLRLTWRDPSVLRIGVDINHAVLVEEGRHWFLPVEANACRLPLGDHSVDLVLFDYALHHFVGQGVMEASIQEASRVLRPGGYIVAREPSSWSLSGLAMNMANRLRLMHMLSGSSNYEFALSPRHLINLFSAAGSIKAVHGLSYLWSRRLPIWIQRCVKGVQPYLFRGSHGPWFADFVLYVIAK
ncbi:MAG TPA: class I SAM-dependent methyltransferase [Thermoanaerobaculia bacterium]|jgi:SAM-dependent methyltransferase|nr:class I SAM-dependent methyltransferase [Thermoanaerobaculia bacterium]